MATADPTPRLDLSGPDLTEAELSAVAAVLDTRWLSLGPRLPEFEHAVANYVGCRYTVAVNSGTGALHLIVRGLGLGEGDEVITTPFSFIASANCLLFERAVPKFVDIDPVTLNLDCDRIEGALTPRTKAILAINVFGHPADWARLRALADAHGLALIEDSCEALGAKYRRTDGSWAQAGSLGDAGCFAFYPNKQITTGEGGIIVTDSEELARLSRSMRNQGRDEGAEWLAHARLGYNYRLSDINCALGLAQMQRLDQILAARRQVAAWYGEALAELEAVQTPPETPDTEISWFVYVVRLRGCEDRETLGRVIAGLRARGIGCSNYFAPIHLQPFYREQFGFQPGDFPVTEGVSTQTIALPFYNRLRREEVARVAEELRQVTAEVLPGAPGGHAEGTVAVSPEAPSRDGRRGLSWAGQVWQFGPLAAWMLVMGVLSGHLGSQETMRDAISWLLRPFFPGAAGQHLGQAVPGPLLWTVRKLAHLAEYAVLALLARRWLGSLTPQTRRAAWGALLLCLLYAGADETHQASVPGRTSSGWDVLIDVTGAALALALARLRQVEGRLFVYRLCDLVGAGVGLLLTSPFLLLGALGVWVTMGRPVLFRHERLGRDGRPFLLLKLRTMREARDAEGKSLPGAARITGLGRLLRSLSVDEFPQFWNVLRGDMSLVGPRPFPLRYLEYYTPREYTRHLVRPGVTGLAQISGRNSLTWDDRLELDAQYVERKSLLFDLRLLVGTVWKVLRRSDVRDEPVQGDLAEHRKQLLREEWGAR